jgi:hypothetical protein
MYREALTREPSGIKNPSRARSVGVRPRILTPPGSGCSASRAAAVEYADVVEHRNDVLDDLQEEAHVGSPEVDPAAGDVGASDRLPAVGNGTETNESARSSSVRSPARRVESSTKRERMPPAMKGVIINVGGG